MDRLSGSVAEWAQRMPEFHRHAEPAALVVSGRTSGARKWRAVYSGRMEEGPDGIQARRARQGVALIRSPSIPDSMRGCELGLLPCAAMCALYQLGQPCHQRKRLVVREHRDRWMVCEKFDVVERGLESESRAVLAA